VYREDSAGRGAMGREAVEISDRAAAAADLAADVAVPGGRAAETVR
jgi:hypothetical protein